MSDKNLFNLFEKYQLQDEGESGFGMDSEFNAPPLEVQREEPLEDGDITAMYFLESDQEEKEDRSLEGLEGPFNFKGRELYYDPKEGQYYDRGTDMYLDNEEASRVIIGESDNDGWGPGTVLDKYGFPHQDLNPPRDIGPHPMDPSPQTTYQHRDSEALEKLDKEKEEKGKVSESDEEEVVSSDYEKIPEEGSSEENLLLDDMEEYILNDDPSLTEYDDEMGIFGGDEGWSGIDSFIFGESDEKDAEERKEFSDSDAETIVDDFLMDEESLPKPPGLDSMSTPPPAPTSSIESMGVKVGDTTAPNTSGAVKVPSESEIESMSSVYEQFDLEAQGPVDYRSMCSDIDAGDEYGEDGKLGRMLDYKGSDEGEMSKRDLMQLSDYARELAQMIRDADDLPEWVQEKISIAKDKIDSAFHYIEYKLEDMREDEGLGESPISPELSQDMVSYFAEEDEY
jgi:hypothetical protein